MKKPLRYVLIGCGRIAQRHAEQMDRTGKLVAVCDIDPNQYLPFVKKYNCRGYEKLDDLLRNEKNNADIAVICTPNGLHAAQSIACLENGWHVLCEKPMAISVSDCDKVISVSSQSGKKCILVQQFRFNKAIQQISQAIRDNKSGKIYIIHLNCFWNRDNKYYANNWHSKKQMEGGILFTQFSHYLDLLIYLMGPAVRINALMKNFSHPHNNFEDSGVIAVEFNNGALGTLSFTVSTYKHNVESSLTIIAEKASIKVSGQYLQKVEYWESNQSPANNFTEEKAVSSHALIYEHIKTDLNLTNVIHPSLLEAKETISFTEKIYQQSIFL